MHNEFVNTGIKLNLLNKEVYGYMLHPSDANQTLEDMKISFTHVKLEWFGTFSAKVTSFSNPVDFTSLSFQTSQYIN